MATATSSVIKTAKTVYVDTKTITLTLTEEEAQTLAEVLGVVSGHPEHSRRKYCDEVTRALNEVGVESQCATDKNGGIAFHNRYDL